MKTVKFRRNMIWHCVCGTSARTVSRILARAGMQRLWDLDPITWDRIRDSRANRLPLRTGRCGGHDPHRRSRNLEVSPRAAAGGPIRHRTAPTVAPRPSNWVLVYVHVAVDDHTRLDYAEVVPDEKGPTFGEFLTRAAAAMAVCLLVLFLLGAADRRPGASWWQCRGATRGM